MKRACENCDFYQSIWTFNGLCRGDLPSNRDGRGDWPTVRRNDWCARFVAKNSTATTVVVGQPYIKE